MKFKTITAIMLTALVLNGFSAVPNGRIAFINDGNASTDPDDICALANQVAMMAIFNVTSRLVHVTYACDSRTSLSGREAALRESLYGAADRWGNFDQSDFFNYHGQASAARTHLKNQINASTSSNPLWIIEAGEPDVIYLAMKDADQSKRQYVRIVTHHSHNDVGVTWDLSDILALPGVASNCKVQISDQNINLKNSPSEYYWMRDHSDSRVTYLWSRGPNATKTNYYDMSDAGMVWYVLTGGPGNGGDQDCSPTKYKNKINGWIGGGSTSYTLTETSPNGSVSFNPAGGSYASGTVVTVTANPSSGYKFSSWSGNLSGSANPTTITMTANKSITANFSAITTGTVTVNDRTTGTGLNQFQYTGTWTTGSNANAYQGNYTISSAANAYAQFRFNGTKVTFYSKLQSSAGKAAISIDGGTEKIVDLYTSGNAWKSVFTSSTLSSGDHTLKVRVTGTRNASSTGTSVIVDRVDVVSGLGKSIYETAPAAAAPVSYTLNVSSLSQNRISFTLPEAGNYSISAFNMAGARVVNRISGSGSTGLNTVAVNQSLLSNQTYIINLRLGKKVSVQRMVPQSK